MRGGAGGKRAVDDVAVAGHPADIGGAPVGVFVAQVEDPLHGHGGLQQVAGGGVDDALGLAGGAGSVEHEERMLAIELLGGADLRRRLRSSVVPPMIAAVLHVDRAAGALVDDDVAHAGAIGERLRPRRP